MSNKELDNMHVEQVDIHSEHAVRIEKVRAMQAAGIDPWPATKSAVHTTQQVITEYKPEGQQQYQIAGRLVSVRDHGKSVFAHVQDSTGKVQIYLKKDLIGEDKFVAWNNYIDIGDIVWFEGTSFVTKMGEVTLQVTDYTLLSKCLYPLPEKFHGLVDVEQCYRQRYLDLISNEESRKRFKARSIIVRSIRQFLDSHGYLEVETPMLHPIAGGAAAKPFKTHHNALDMELYLRIAPELYLKRLVVGGFDRVYEINRNFRNEGISTKHNPEFTMLEFYTAYQDYNFAMDMVEQMFQFVCKQICSEPMVAYGSTVLDFSKPFERLTMRAAVAKYADCSQEDLAENNIDKVISAHKLKLAPGMISWGHKLCFLFDELVEKQLVQPTFITEFPVEVSPLAKRNAQNPAVTDRFELYMMSMELSNAFTELNDPFDQADRFAQQAKARSAGDVEAHFYDADFIKSLEYAMPPTVGVGIGIDRLTMLLTGALSIRDVILFPTLRSSAQSE